MRPSRLYQDRVQEQRVNVGLEIPAVTQIFRSDRDPEDLIVLPAAEIQHHFRQTANHPEHGGHQGNADQHSEQIRDQLRQGFGRDSIHADHAEEFGYDLSLCNPPLKIL